jgi:hypothetical protein
MGTRLDPASDGMIIRGGNFTGGFRTVTHLGRRGVRCPATESEAERETAASGRVSAREPVSIRSGPGRTVSELSTWGMSRVRVNQWSCLVSWRLTRIGSEPWLCQLLGASRRNPIRRGAGK